MRKKMKKISIIIGALVALLSPAVASNGAMFGHDRRIEYSQLPTEAQAFVKRYFADDQVAFVEIDEGIVSNEYKVVFDSGHKLEFDGSGNWLEVDCRNEAVPAPLVPKQIASYVESKHPNHKIVELKRERYEWEVKLSNGLELTFDKKYRLTDVDD